MVGSRFAIFDPIKTNQYILLTRYDNIVAHRFLEQFRDETELSKVPQAPLSRPHPSSHIPSG